MNIRLLGAILVTTAVLACHAHRTQRIPAPRAALTPLPSPPTLVSFTQTFNERVGDTTSMMMTLELRVDRDSVVSTIRGLHGDSLVQEIVDVLGRNPLRTRAVRDSSHADRVSLNYSGDRLSGTIQHRNRLDAFNTLPLNLRIDSLTIDRRSLLVVVPWLPLIPGEVLTLRIYDSFLFGAYLVDVRTREGERITVPAGTFDTYRVEVTARLPEHLCTVHPLFPTTLWVRADSLRHIVQIERPNTRTVYELVTHQEYR